MSVRLPAAWEGERLDFAGPDGGFPAWELAPEDDERLPELLGAARRAGAELLTHFAEATGEGPLLRWLLALPVRGEGASSAGEPAGAQVVVLRARPRGGRLPSSAAEWPVLAWYERRIRDEEGLEFTGHPDPRPILRH
ncbi:MAG: NADH-quinone oxidoreductase subunit C, partial [Clostridia bacterium]|nr:NADH-quinone oxidoreductase subunit C [Clostridia bacterium]